MKKKSLIFSALSVLTLGGILLGTACRKDNNINGDHAAVAGVLTACDGGVAITGDSVINTDINTDLTLVATKRYVLNRIIYVYGNHTLNIEAGTRIVGKVGSNTLGGVPGGGLVITKGSKINAVGAANNPIVFTSANADSTGKTPQSGDWAGVILLGKAPANTPTTKTIEGINPGGSIDATYGGTDPHDNSGTLKYVRIEYAGYALSTDNEINALTFGAVGDGTTIDYVEAYKSNDDSFEWFGGTVNASHLLSIDGLDDMFDTDNGFSGTITYALGLSDQARADKSQSNGFESDNNATGDSIAPFTHPKYNFVTIIGVTAARDTVTNSLPSGSGLYGRAAHIRRNAEFEISNSLFVGFAEGISLDTQLPAAPHWNTKTKYDLDTSKFDHVYAGGYSLPFSTEINHASFAAFTPKATQVTGTITPTTFANPFARTGIANYIPTIASTLRPYGAFPGGTDWTVAPGCASLAKWVKLTGL